MDIIHLKGVQQMKRYSPEFKAEAVKLVLDGNQSMSQVSRDLKIALQTLSTWVARAREGKLAGTVTHNSHTATLEAENKRLKKALAVAEMEREILKKAAAYFAKDIVRGTHL
jgi:transposase